MAKNSLSIDALCRQIAEDAAHGRFSPIYLLMGDEPYYPELVCREIQRHCIPEEDKDFNETVWYGSDVDADEVVSEARRYPMMAERRLSASPSTRRLPGTGSSSTPRPYATTR